MTNSPEPTDLALVAEQLVDQPAFLAAWLAASPPPAAAELQRRLGLSERAHERLRLCQGPRPTSFVEDVESIAEFVGIDADRLAAGLRELVAVTALTQARQPLAEFTSIAAPLAAAHDANAEPTSHPSRGTQQLRQLARNLWADTPERLRDPSRFEQALAWALPLAVVTIDELSLQAAASWLRERGVPADQLPERPVHGLLIAWRGLGLILIDGQLDRLWRRFVLAHEAAHFLLDHLQPRRQLLRDAPELLDVVDGHRTASRSDRARAVLARVPLRVQTHLLARDPHGGAEEQVATIEDDASRFALELLAPWDAALATVRRAVNLGSARAATLAVATNILASRFELPDPAARARAAMILDQLGIRRSFFDR